MAVVLGLVQAWTERHAMNNDGTHYLDMGDAFWRGDWDMAINAYWSPLYAWLLGLAVHLVKPSAYWELTVAHAVNFGIYLGALASFDFLLRECVRHLRVAAPPEPGSIALSDRSWVVVGYVLFLWSSLDVIRLARLTPDLLVAAFMYLAAGILLRIRTGRATSSTFAALGLVLGVGYLAKAPLFPLAFVFLAVAFLAARDRRAAVPHTLIALVVFLAIAGPLVVTLSRTKGRLTFGDSGRLNYAWSANRVPNYHWRGETPRTGQPAHPTRQLMASPAVYEFADPVGGTFPVWYDPSYWYEGLSPYFDLKAQIRVSARTARTYYRELFGLDGVLVTTLLVLFSAGARGKRLMADILRQWVLLVPAVAALGMYSLVNAVPRYIAPLIVLVYLALFSAVRLRESRESRSLLTGVTLAVLLMFAVSLGPRLARAGALAARELVISRELIRNRHWEIVDGLQRLGIEPGDKIAVASESVRIDSRWGRVGRVRVIAQVHSRGATDPPMEGRVFQTLSQAGVTHIVADGVPRWSSRDSWQRAGATKYYARPIPR